MAEGPTCERSYPYVQEADRLFRALADGTRLAILGQLRDEDEVCACDFSPCCETVSQPTVSYHLKILRQAGLVSSDRRGLCLFYRLNEGTLERVRGLLP